MSAFLDRWPEAKHGKIAILIFWWIPARKPAPGFPPGLVLDLEEILGCKVEVVTEKGLNPYLKERVLQEALPL